MGQPEELLKRYHTEHAEATPSVFTLLRDSGGLSSYEHLVRWAGTGGTVLDLACGGGLLLEQLSPAFERRIGVDLVPAQISRAQSRLGTRAELHVGRADALPVSDASVDVLTCHMAFMLMQPVEAVVTEMARVLAPSGRVVLLLPWPREPSAVDRVYFGHLRPAVKGLGDESVAHKLGDGRTRSVEGLDSLFTGAHGFHDLRHEDLSVSVCDLPERIWPHVEGMYGVYEIPAQQRSRLEAAIIEDWRGLADRDGRIVFGMGLRILEAVRI